MEESGEIRMAWKAAAAILAAFIAAMGLSASAQAGNSLSLKQAQRATIQSLKLAGEGGDFRHFGVESCVRKGAMKFKCRGTLGDDRGDPAEICSLSFTVKKKSGATLARLLRKSCRPDPAPYLSRSDARSAVAVQGYFRYMTEVNVIKLVRVGRSDFSATLKWSTMKGSGLGDCTIGAHIVSSQEGANVKFDDLYECDYSDPYYVPTVNPSQSGPGPKYCPGNLKKKTWDAVPDIVGKTLDEAIAIAAQHGCSVRPVKVDGESQIITMDFSFSRLNVAVEGPERIVTEIVNVS